MVAIHMELQGERRSIFTFDCATDSAFLEGRALSSSCCPISINGWGRIVYGFTSAMQFIQKSLDYSCCFVVLFFQSDHLSKSNTAGLFCRLTILILQIRHWLLQPLLVIRHILLLLFFLPLSTLSSVLIWRLICLLCLLLACFGQHLWRMMVDHLCSLVAGLMAWSMGSNKQNLLSRHMQMVKASLTV